MKTISRMVYSQPLTRCMCGSFRMLTSRNSLLLAFLFLFFITDKQVNAQNDDNEKLVSFYGYVGYEAIFDTHESVFTRDGELYLYPSAPKYHPTTGGLINRNLQHEMLSLQSRAGARISGPNVMGAKLTGVLEGDFFATAEAYKHHLRVRHAMMKLQWDKLAVTMGQYWHPMFTPEVFPLVESFGAAAPFNPLNRSPQIRFDYQPIPSLKLVAAALAHGYHFSIGPEDAQRNSGIPDLQFQIHLGSTPNLTTGVTLGYMWLKPFGGIVNGEQYYSDNSIGAYNLQWFGRAKTSNFTLQAKVSYGENMTQFVMIGGYGRQLADTAKLSDYNYANLRTFAGWVEGIYDVSEVLQLGVLVGAMGVLGSNEKIDTEGPIWYTRAANMARGYRLSPRIVYRPHKSFSLAIEYLYNTADYGSSFDDYGVPQDLTRTLNHRFLFAAKYFF